MKRRLASERRRKRCDEPANVIDYDKLADAIVSAQELAKKKKRSTSKFRGSLMSFINGSLYISIALVAVLIVIGIWVQYTKEAVYPLLNYIVATVLFSILGIYAFLCHQESLYDSAEDAQQHFNTNLTLLALLISLVALTRG